MPLKVHRSTDLDLVSESQQLADVCPYFIVLAAHLRPDAFNGSISPRGELPSLFLVECPKETERFHGVERRLAVVVCRVKLRNEMVYQKLMPPRIPVVEHILQ